MLRKLRWKFIFVAMSSLLIVLFLLVAGINLLSYRFITNTQDQLLQMIATTSSNPRLMFPREGPPKNPRGMDLSPEATFTTRFFIVRTNSEGNITEVYRDFIASVTDAEAREYASSVLDKGKTAGYYKDYRYLTHQDANETLQIFLNSRSELQFIQLIFIVSITVAFISFLAVFLLVFLFSKRAIQPFVQNIERQKRFITDASHEIKTPITSISTSADILALEHQDNEWVNNIQKQTLRLTNLVKNLVTLSRLDEESPIPEQTNFSISDVAWESAELFAFQMKAANKTYKQQIQEDLMYYGDVNEIQQMITILLDNAIRHSTPDGTIQLLVYKKRKNIFIEIMNTWDMVEMNDLDKLFERFYRPDQSRSRSTGGTGIGLSIAKAIVEAHKGKISVKKVSPDLIMFQVIL